MCKNHRVFLNILGGLKYPQTVTTNFGGQNNIKNEFTAPSKYSDDKFSAKSNNF